MIIKEFRSLTFTGVEYTRYGEIPKFAEELYPLEHDCYACMVPNGWGIQCGLQSFIERRKASFKRK